MLNNIPDSVKWVDVIEALQPLCELLGVEATNLSQYGIAIEGNTITMNLYRPVAVISVEVTR